MNSLQLHPLPQTSKTILKNLALMSLRPQEKEKATEGAALDNKFADLCSVPESAKYRIQRSQQVGTKSL